MSFPGAKVATTEVNIVQKVQTNPATGLNWALSPRLSKSVYRLLAHLLLIAVGILFIFPFVWLISSSLKTPRQIFVFPPQWIPDPVQWQNYSDALTAIPALSYFFNTLIICVGVVIGTLFSSSTTAYSFSRIHWPGRDTIFVLVLATLMLPYQVTMIPVYLFFHRLGWIGTYWPLIVPAFFGSPFFIFLLRQFFLTIPMDLSDAARIDGCSELGIFRRIVLPLAKPALTTTVLLSFLWTYTDYLAPLIYLTDPDMYTLSIGLASFVGMNIQKWELIMAASTMFTLPTILLYFFSQKTFVQGIQTTGLGGA
jgi:multiple sugar transport system permease protein